MLQPQVVAEEVRDLALKRSSFASASSRTARRKLDTQPGSLHRLRKLDDERAGLVLPVVVEEVLLDAVEDHVDVAAEPRGARLQRVRQRAHAARCRPRLQQRREPSRRVVLPRIEDDDAERIPSERSVRATPARSTELLPTPVSP